MRHLPPTNSALRVALVGLLALVALAPAEAARPVPTQASLGRVGERRVSMNRVRIREEGHPAQMRGEGNFIAPNEFARVFAPVLRGRAASGGVLSVGTFRGLEDAVHALEGIAGLPKGFHLIQLDVDAGVTRFNEANAASIAHAESRTDYRAHLAGGPTQQRHEAGPGWRGLPTMALRGLPPRARAQALVAATLAASTPIATPLPDYVRALEHDASEDPHTLLGDDGRFARAQELVRAGRVRALNGSLIGGRTMRDLGRALRARGERLSVIDLSNAGDWIASGRGGDVTGDLLRLADNLEALPLSDDAVVLLTSDRDYHSTTFRTPRPSDLTVGWAYHAIPARELLRVLRAPEAKPGWGNPRWQAMLDASTAGSAENAHGLRWAGDRAAAPPAP